MAVYQYADFYNLFHKDKNYTEEVNYIDNLIKKHCVINAKTMLDVGCLSGKHACNFSQKGYKVFAIDRSPKMIEIASSDQDTDCAFLIADVNSYSFQKSFDLIVSLSYVASYQITNQMFDSYLKNAVKHLSAGGLFVFDFLYGPAILQHPPETRVKRFRSNKQNVVRIGEPEMHYDENCMTIKYEVMINELGECSAFSENHKMRYFFLPELEKYCDDAGLIILSSLEWMKNDTPPSHENRNAVIVAMKK